MKKMTEKRQNYVTSRMRRLQGYRYFQGIHEVSKFEIAHSGLDVMKVLAGQTFVRVKIRENGSK